MHLHTIGGKSTEAAGPLIISFRYPFGFAFGRLQDLINLSMPRSFPPSCLGCLVARSASLSNAARRVFEDENLQIKRPLVRGRVDKRRAGDAHTCRRPSTPTLSEEVIQPTIDGTVKGRGGWGCSLLVALEIIYDIALRLSLTFRTARPRNRLHHVSTITSPVPCGQQVHRR